MGVHGSGVKAGAFTSVGLIYTFVTCPGLSSFRFFWEVTLMLSHTVCIEVQAKIMGQADMGAY